MNNELFDNKQKHLQDQISTESIQKRMRNLSKEDVLFVKHILSGFVWDVIVMLVMKIEI